MAEPCGSRRRPAAGGKSVCRRCSPTPTPSAPSPSAVEGTLGPKGLNCMLIDTLGDVTITNDGSTISTRLRSPTRRRAC